MYSDTIDVLWLYFTNETGAADNDTRRPNAEEIAAFKVYANATEETDSKDIDKWVESYFVPESKGLLDIISPELATEETGFCVQDTTFEQFQPKTNKRYYDWEKEVAQPELEKLGYKVISWNTGDRDSFGPLTRYAKVEKGGVKFDLVYG